MNQATHKALILDLGGVITLAQDTSCFNELAREFDTDISAVLSAMAEFRQTYDAGTLTPRQYWKEVFTLLSKGQGDPEEITERYFEWGYTADYLSWSHPRNEVHQLAGEILDRKGRLGIISNMPLTLDDHFVQTWPWLGQVEHALYSGHLHLAKPEPEIYRLFLERSAWNPADILYVDDRKENLAVPAEMGMKTLHFRGTCDDIARMRDHAGLPALTPLS